MNTDQTPYPLDLEAIRQRVEAATPDPWELIGGDEFVTGADVLVAPDDGGVTAENAIFIAHARADVPALLAEVERLHAGITDAAETARALCRQLACTPTCGCTCCDLRDDLTNLTRQTEGA